MKLWQKTSLIFTVVLLVIVLVCSSVLLVHSKNSILELTYSQARDKQHNLAVSFSEMAAYHIDEGDSQAARDSLVMYCFSRYADASCVLIRDDETIYTGVTIDPSEYLPLDFEQNAAVKAVETEVSGRNIYIVGSVVRIGEQAYSVYVVEDISTVYNSIGDMVVTFIAVSGASIVVGAAVTALIIRRSTRHVSQLAQVTGRIADGEYAMRAHVGTKDEIGELAGDFNRMADAVEAHVASLTETAERQRLFIGGVTHEFKTPLTSLILHARMLRRSYMTDEEKDNSLEHIETQCQWLERLVQTLLRVITLDEEVERKPVSAPELLERVRQSAQKTLADRSVNLEIRCDTDVLNVNADLMQSLLINLVDNAAKSYDGASTKTVLLTANDNAVEVKDFGRGIPADALARIFEPFYMVDKSRSKKAGGSGLGLALVKAIADAHGAAVHVESAPGQGTTVRVTFA